MTCAFVLFEITFGVINIYLVQLLFPMSPGWLSHCLRVAAAKGGGEGSISKVAREPCSSRAHTETIMRLLSRRLGTQHHANCESSRVLCKGKQSEYVRRIICNTILINALSFPKFTERFRKQEANNRNQHKRLRQKSYS